MFVCHHEQFSPPTELFTLSKFPTRIILSQHLVNDIYITKYQKFWTITGIMDYRAMIVNTTSFGISIIIDYHYYYYKLQQSHKSNIQIRVLEQSWINLKSISVKMGKKIDNSVGFGWLTN